MKRLVIVLFAALTSTVHAGSALEANEASGLAVKGASEFHALYQAYLEKGFPNLQGHTMAAAVLASCRPGDAKKFEVSMEILAEMSRYRLHPDPALRMIGADARRFPQITYTAAVLTCKRGGLDIITLVRKMATIFLNIQIDGKTNLPHNVVVAADLLAPQP